MPAFVEYDDFTPEERHEAVMASLTKIGKDSSVFHLRWTAPDPITGKVLKGTPMFWYMVCVGSESEPESRHMNRFAHTHAEIRLGATRH